ncbi:WW domain-binding protein 1-like [Rhinophrynus dorsalis]
MRREELELGVRGSVYGRDFCFGEDQKPYRCEIGYCCGDSECCTYYYELWWFWLAWTVIIMIGCCCAYRHRKIKLRHQLEQRQREISLMAYQGATACPSSLETWSSCKLPSYDEVTQVPPSPPPPYSEILEETHTHIENPSLHGTTSTSLDLAGSHQGRCLTDIQSPTSVLEDNELRDTAAEHFLPHQTDADRSAWERRRHVTGDSGIVLYEQEDQAARWSQKQEDEEEREGIEYVILASESVEAGGEDLQGERMTPKERGTDILEP